MSSTSTVRTARSAGAAASPPLGTRQYRWLGMVRMLRHSDVPLLRGLDRREQQAQVHLEQIDVGDRDGDVPVDHHALVEDAVQQVAENQVPGGLFAHASSPRAK